MKPPLTYEERQAISLLLRAQANQIAWFYEAGRPNVAGKQQYPDPVLTALDREMSRIRDLSERIKPDEPLEGATE